MDLLEDKPRPNPKPVPFSQDVIFEPVVPEVSLLVQEHEKKESVNICEPARKIESNSYNCWRWEQINGSRESSIEEKNKSEMLQLQCFSGRDRYIVSEIEKRKNELLYGEKYTEEEPRRPLPPRTCTFVPPHFEFMLPDSSLEKSVCVSNSGKPSKNLSNSVVNQDHVKSFEYKSWSKPCFSEQVSNSEQFSKIMSVQHKQIKILELQMEQLLKLQDVKDKQIDQLLKAQESKEMKIQQLLKLLDVKNREMEEFIKWKEEQNVYLQEAFKIQQRLKNENEGLVEALKSRANCEHKETQTMVSIHMTDASTCTTLDHFIEDSPPKENALLSISVLRDSREAEEKEKSLSLHLSDVAVRYENAASPQSSIHVDIQDFPDSSQDESLDATLPTSHPITLGYTFYNNVLAQLKGIIGNADEKAEMEMQGFLKKGQNLEKNSTVLPVPNAVTHKFCNIDSEGDFSSTQGSLETKSKEKNSPSDMSLKINALAVKYLKPSQVEDFGVKSSGSKPCQGDLTIYSVTNLSFGSMRYLDKYHMLPKSRQAVNQVVSSEMLSQGPIPIGKGTRGVLANVLDFNALSQQHKLF